MSGDYSDPSVLFNSIRATIAFLADEVLSSIGGGDVEWQDWWSFDQNQYENALLILREGAESALSSARLCHVIYSAFSVLGGGRVELPNIVPADWLDGLLLELSQKTSFCINGLTNPPTQRSLSEFLRSFSTRFLNRKFRFRGERRPPNVARYLEYVSRTESDKVDPFSGLSSLASFRPENLWLRQVSHSQDVTWLRLSEFLDGLPYFIDGALLRASQEYEEMASHLVDEEEESQPSIFETIDQLELEEHYEAQDDYLELLHGYSGEPGDDELGDDGIDPWLLDNGPESIQEFCRVDVSLRPLSVLVSCPEGETHLSDEFDSLHYGSSDEGAGEPSSELPVSPLWFRHFVVPYISDRYGFYDVD